MRDLKFKCPNCGDSNLTEALKVRSLRRITEANELGESDVLTNIDDEEEVLEYEGYYCSYCGTDVVDTSGDRVMKWNDMLEWLKLHDTIEIKDSDKVSQTNSKDVAVDRATRLTWGSSLNLSDEGEYFDVIVRCGNKPPRALNGAIVIPANELYRTSVRGTVRLGTFNSADAWSTYVLLNSLTGKVMYRNAVMKYPYDEALTHMSIRRMRKDLLGAIEAHITSFADGRSRKSVNPHYLDAVELAVAVLYADITDTSPCIEYKVAACLVSHCVSTSDYPWIDQEMAALKERLGLLENFNPKTKESTVE